MQVRQLDSWNEFLVTVRNIRASQNLEEHSVTGNNLLFRGQADSRWGLKTSLERVSKSPSVDMSSYYRKVWCCAPHLEAYTDRKWCIPKPSIYAKNFNSFDKLIQFEQMEEEFELMVFLRHHGFPSPLLDWSRSLYVSSFFAFESIPADAEFVSIFCFLEYIQGGKVTSSDKPFIRAFGPYVRSHKRHFLQQSNYTVCLEIDDECPRYVSHELVLNSNDSTQDVAWEFQIPATDRHFVLSHLDSMNINSLSLRGTIDSLVSTVSFREFEVRGMDT